MAFDSNDMLASGSEDKTIKLWNKNNGGLLRTLLGHGEFVRTVAFDSTYLLASGSWDKTIKIWNKNYGNLLWTLTGHGGAVWSVAFDSTYLLASGSSDRTGEDKNLWISVKHNTCMICLYRVCKKCTHL